jgi:hypothetical protein
VRNSFDKWREYDAEDTIRFYALRLRDVGLIKSTPQKIIADGTDWRFLNESQERAEGVNTGSANRRDLFYGQTSANQARENNGSFPPVADPREGAPRLAANG